jgi:hypothetical protein
VLAFKSSALPGSNLWQCDDNQVIQNRRSPHAGQRVSDPALCFDILCLTSDGRLVADAQREEAGAQISASGEAALEKFIDDAARRGTRTILSNVQPEVRKVIEDLGLSKKPTVLIVKNFQKALLAASE